MNTVNDLVVINHAVIKAVVIAHRKVAVEVVGSFSCSVGKRSLNAVLKKQLGRVGEVVVEQLVLVVALLCIHEKAAYRQTYNNQCRQYN